MDCIQETLWISTPEIRVEPILRMILDTIRLMPEPMNCASHEETRRINNFSLFLNGKWKKIRYFQKQALW